MIYVLPHQKIDQQKWDTCILKSKHSSIYGLFDSISVACENWLSIIYKDYEAVAVLPVKKKLGLVYSWHPQFMGPLGVFTNQENPEIIKEMLGELSKHSLWIKMYYWQKEAPSRPSPGGREKAHPDLPFGKEKKIAKNYKIVEKVYQELAIENKNIELIRSGYNENTKRNYKKAVKQSLTVRHISDVNLVINTFKENKGNQIENINEDSYTLLKKLMDHWLQKGLGHITAIYDKDQLSAIGYFLVHHNTIIYYKGAVTELGKANGAMHFLIDHEIENNLNQCKYFDFGGSNTESVARFYRGFGGVDKYYYLHEFKRFKI